MLGELLLPLGHHVTGVGSKERNGRLGQRGVDQPERRQPLDHPHHGVVRDPLR